MMRQGLVPKRISVTRAGKTFMTTVNVRVDKDIPKTKPKAEVKEKIETTKTEAFKKWFGDSKVVDDSGEPIVVYHGTTHDFESFDSSKTGNIEGALGAGHYFTTSSEDASINYAGIGADLEGRIEMMAERFVQMIQDDTDVNEVMERYGVSEERAEEMQEDWDVAMEYAKIDATKELKGDNDGAIVPAYLKMENPFDMSEDGEDVISEMDEEYYLELAKDEVERDEYDSEDEYEDAVQEMKMQIYYDDYDPKNDGNGSGIMEAIEKVKYNYENVDELDLTDVIEGLQEGISPKNLHDALKHTFRFSHDDEGNIAGNQIVADILKEAGFDGFVQDAHIEFGQNRKYGKPMEGIEYGDRHYIVFESNQIKSAIGNTGEFTDSSDITKALSRLIISKVLK